MCPSGRAMANLETNSSEINNNSKERIYARRKGRHKQPTTLESAPKNVPCDNEIQMIYPEQSWWDNYGKDMFDTLCLQEKAWPNLTLRSPQLEFRAALVKTICDTAATVNASEETVFLAVRYLDRFMMDHDILPCLLKCVAFTALLVAAKLDDTWDVARKCGKLRDNECFYDGNILRLEWNLCSCFNWRMNTPTILSFAKVAAKKFVDNDRFTSVLREFLDIALKDKHLALSRPSLVGVSCVYAALTALELAVTDDELPEQVMGVACSKESVMPIVDRLVKLREILVNKFKRKHDESSLRRDFMQISLNPPPTKHIKIAVT